MINNCKMTRQPMNAKIQFDVELLAHLHSQEIVGVRETRQNPKAVQTIPPAAKAPVVIMKRCRQNKTYAGLNS